MLTQWEGRSRDGIRPIGEAALRRAAGIKIPG